MSAAPPRFRNWQAPRALPQPSFEKGKLRNSPRLRGLNSKWDRLSIAFRRQHSTCRFCEQEGRLSASTVADHIIPAQDRPELRYEWKNLEALCAACHDTTKQRMEFEARRTGSLDSLPVWCSSLDNRPRKFWPLGLETVKP